MDEYLRHRMLESGSLADLEPLATEIEFLESV